MAPRCNGKAKSTGKRCTNPVKRQGLKCRYHGGKSTGPKTKKGKARTRKNAKKHGIYGDKISAEENKWGRSIKDGPDSLEHEIFVARLQIRRALAEWDKWEGENPPTGDKIPLMETTVTDDTASGRIRAVMSRRRPDLWAIIDRALGRVGRLVQVQTGVIEIRDLRDELAEVRKEQARQDATHNAGT